MRDRDRILTNLAELYTEAFRKAEERSDEPEMTRLDFGYQRDQLYLETLLDVRDLLSTEEPEARPGLVERAKALRDLTRLKIPGTS